MVADILLHQLGVYPRVGGETETSALGRRRMRGLSPRGRGNLTEGFTQSPVVGSIPAWAGKPPMMPGPASTLRVYPRVGGETITAAQIPGHANGLSPRGRGNLTIHRLPLPYTGSIPAWAGKPTPILRRLGDKGVYPRVGGEPRAGSPGCGRRWVYPRVGGETRLPQSDAEIGRVYPRVGGETGGLLVLAAVGWGLSPRGRGNLGSYGCAGARDGSIPAWAGKPMAQAVAQRSDRVYPRVGGETDGAVTGVPAVTGLSPRGRGNPGRSWLGQPGSRSIPAWAGKPVAAQGRPGARRVYPRVGGETVEFNGKTWLGYGLSPRGRGNQR